MGAGRCGVAADFIGRLPHRASAEPADASSSSRMRAMRRPWLRPVLYTLAALLLLAAVLAAWLVRSFDGERVKRTAIEWMQTHHARTLAIDGPLTLRLWPQPAVAVQGVRLSEAGRPDELFAAIDEASLTLQLEPLLARREIEVGEVYAKGVRLTLRREADGRRNVADLVALAAGDGEARQRAQPWTIEGVELTQAELDVADAVTGLAGHVSVQQFSLGRFGPGVQAPLHLQGEAVLTQPALRAAVVLDTGIELLQAREAGAPPVALLDKPRLSLRGVGFGVEALAAQLQAASARIDPGASPGFGEGRVGLDALKLQFGGTWLGWQIDTGALALARLQLDVQQRTLDLEALALDVKGRQAQTTLAATFAWPTLKVAGDTLQGGPMSGRLTLGGDEKLQLALSSQAPSGGFDRLTVPALQVGIDGRLGSSTVQGQAGATLVLAPKPLAAALDAMTLNLRLSDAALPPLALALDGQARWSPQAGNAQVRGTVNGQSVQARIDAALDRPRRYFDVDASFGTLDLDRFIAPASRSAAAAPAAAQRPVDLQGLAWADARLRLKVAQLVRKPYRFDALDADAAIDNGVLTLRRLAGRAWGGRFEASGSADSGSGQLALRLNASDVDLRALLADTVGYDGLQGRGRIDADLRSRGSTTAALRAGLSGRAALSLRPAAIRGVDLAQTLRGWRTATQSGTDAVASNAARRTEFSQLDASFDVSGGQARSTDLDGRSDFLRVAGEGTIDLAQNRVDYLLRVRVVDTATGRAGPEMALLNGVTVPVELQGPFGGVEWKVRWPAVTAAVAALSVPNAVVGTVGGVTRGATSVLRGATGVLRGGATKPPP